MYMMMLIMLIFFIFINMNNFLLLKFLSNNWIEMSFNFNNLNIIFSFVVLFISLMIIIYSKMYFNFKMKMNFKINLIIFIMSMIILINSNNFIVLLIGWDGLGISSFFLISIYFNLNSMISSLITFFFNRIGDAMLIIFCSIIMSLNMNFNLMNLNMMMFLIIFLGLITKSCQIPFGVWLPLAMSAPTPISSLVHSSTLVTAGIFMLMKMEYFFFIKEVQMLIMMFSLLTFFFAGMFALSIMDFKKAIAFSTLSQMGFILFSLSMGMIKISFIHMMFHAFFKSSLFMNLGLFMMFNFSIQDFRMINKYSLNKMFKISFFISTINLMGLMFSTGFLSKDFILMFFSSSYFLILINLMFFFGCIFTGSYSLKFLMFFFFSEMKILNLKNNIKMNFFFLKLILFSILILIIPMIFMEFLILDLSLILLNMKFLFYLIVMFSFIIYKIFSMMKSLLFSFSEMLYILDLINFIFMKLMFMLMKIMKLVSLEEYIQLNLINYQMMSFKFNTFYSINLIFFLIIFNYLPSQ